MRLGPPAASIPIVLTIAVVAFVSILFGNISYEVFVAALGNHFYKFVDQNQTILEGHSVQYVFQQRMLPSWEISLIEKGFGLDRTAANFVFYRSFFVLSSLLTTAMCLIAGLDARRSIILTAVFSAANIFVIVAGYWVMAFDLQNLACVQVLFLLFMVRMQSSLRIVLLCALGAIWQFTLEEVIYIPIFWLLYTNAMDLGALRFKPIFRSPKNWAVAALIPVSMILTNVTRKWLLVGADIRGSHTQVMSQDLQTTTNITTMVKQIGSLIHPLRTLHEDYWMQGVGLFLALNICAVCLIPSYKALLRHPFRLASTLMFVCMSSVSFLFAHLEETNTMMPMVVNLLAIYLSQGVFLKARPAAMDAEKADTIAHIEPRSVRVRV